MPDIEAIDGVAAGDVEGVNGVAKSNIQAINGVGIAASGATRWAISTDDMYISWANAADIADVTAWEGNMYAIIGSSSVDTIDIGYGLDGSGNAKWMTVSNTNADEIKFDDNNDITDESAWTTHNIHTDYGNAKQSTIVYGAGDGASDSSSGSSVTRVGCWISSGRTSSSNVWVHRSVDGGANWTHLNLQGLTNIAGSTSSDNHLHGLASDGTGNWMVAQKGNLYFSSDSGVSFAYLIQPSGNGAHLIRDIVYTNSTWVVIYKDGAALYTASCAGSTLANMDASGDWSNAVELEDAAGDGLSGNNLNIRAAAAGGRVVAKDHNRTLAFTVNGKNDPVIVGTRQSVPDEGNLNCIATDGTTWLVGSDGGLTGEDGGDICRSLDGGESWTKICEGIQEAGNRKIEGIAANVLLPL
jgi:hypothetical protein